MAEVISLEDNAEELIGLLATQGPGNVVALTYASAMTLSAAAVASFQTVTLTGNVTFTLPAPVAGAEFRLTVTQDGTGSRTATFAATSGAVKFAGGSKTLSTAAGTVDIIDFASDGTNWNGLLTKAWA